MPYSYEEICKRLEDSAKSGAQAVCFMAADVTDPDRLEREGHRIQRIGLGGVIVTVGPKYVPNMNAAMASPASITPDPALRNEEPSAT